MTSDGAATANLRAQGVSVRVADELLLLLLRTHALTAEFLTARPVTASMNLRFTVQGGQGKRRNMRRMVPETFGKRSA